MQPLVSVIIPSYGRPAETRRAVESALAQSYQNLQIIIVDDNGLKSEMHVLTKEALTPLLSDVRVEYIIHEVNMGGNVARNSGAKAAKGKYIALLDSDDLFHPEKISLQVAYLEKHNTNTTVRAVTCNRIICAGGRTISTTSLTGTGNFAADILLFRKVLGAGSTLLIERRVLFEIGLFDTELKRHQEVEMLMRYFEKYQLTILPEVLVEIHTDDRSNIPNPSEFIYTKTLFFNKIENTLNKLSADERHRVKQLHTLEVAKVFLRHGDPAHGLKYVIKARPSVMDMYKFFADALRALKGRIWSNR